MDGDLVLQHQRFLRRLVSELVRDEHAAEDLAQTTWLRALEHPPREGSPARAWLARVARNLALNRGRAERRARDGREEIAEERSWPPAAEVAARLELAERVLAAVRELSEPLRAVVLARYYEELPLEEIARRSGAPLDTVKERLKRARELLRRRLGRELGEESDLAGIVTLCARWVERIGGGLLVKKTVAVVVVLLVGLFAWFGWRARGTNASTPVTVAAVPELVAAPASEPAHVATAERIAAPAPESLAATTSGSLLVSVSWADGTPAERVTVSVWADEERELARFFRVATTGTDGLARIDALAAGSYRVQLDREKDFARAEVRAGEETRVELAVSAGQRVEGVVVDHQGQPVAGAGVWVTKWFPTGGSGRSLTEGFAAITSPDGRFAIPSMGSAIELGARAEGYAPSKNKAVRFSGRPIEEVRLVLPELGGVLAGRVLGPEGEGVANAVVIVDVGFRSESYPSGGERIINQLRLAVLTTADGSFRIGGVQPGNLELMVFAPDRLRSKQDVLVTASATTWVDVALERGESVTGRVVTPDGTPLAGALVFASLKPRKGPLPEDANWSLIIRSSTDDYASTRSGPDGSYHLTGLLACPTFVAADAGEAGRTLESLRLEPGSATRMDLVVSRGLELRCRLVDASGKPLAGVMVFVARNREDGATAGSREPYRTDAEGRFAAANCQDALYSLDIRHARYDRRVACAAASSLRPRPDEQTIVVDCPDVAPAFVRGVVVDDRGGPLANASVGCRNQREGFSGATARTDATGAFLMGELEPGSYRVSVTAEGFPYLKLGIFELAMGQTLDLGTVRLKTAGFLSVQLRREDGGPVDDLFDVSLDTATERRVENDLEVELGVARFRPIEPGDYVLHVEGQVCLDPRLPVHIEAGVTTELDLLLRVGGYRALRFPGHENASVISHLHVVVRGAAGKIVFEDSVEEAGDGFLTGHAFERGSYTLEASCDDGRQASGAFEVLDREPFDGSLDFDLR